MGGANSAIVAVGALACTAHGDKAVDQKSHSTEQAVHKPLEGGDAPILFGSFRTIR
jgi:hypothetical protein